MASSSSRPKRSGGSGVQPESADPVYSFVRKALLERFKNQLKVSRSDVDALTALEEAEDEEMLVPVDLRERLNQSAEAMRAEMKEPRLSVEAYIRSEQVFQQNTEGLSARPAPMTAQAWREQNLEDDADFDQDLNKMQDAEGDEEEGAEEEELELDEELDVDEEEEKPAPEEATDGPLPKRRKVLLD
mmetsp:Transcript_36064/g.58193  ORF Transcript_36064/g.58193 Transcript_36064/m.58193 type:complete len:187 (+) Transcript_36064:48-608(+)